jgi:glycosyltransferase involved in cell wall biosynthesis
VNLVFNALSWGYEHVPFDAALIASVAQAFPESPVHFHGESTHVRETRQYLEARFRDGPVVWREVGLPDRRASARGRLAPDLRLTRAILAEAERSPGSRVIACGMHAVSGLGARKTLSQVYRRSQVAYVHHGALSQLLSSRRYHPLLTLLNGRLRQVVLGDFIREESLRRLPILRGALHAIPHPYFFGETAPSELRAGEPIRFSFLGIVDESKGFSDFVALAKKTAAVAGGSACFELIGSTRDGAPTDSWAQWVTIRGGGGPMPRPAFESYLQQTGYTIFPYKPGSYNLTASGALMDALAAGKPLIALRNSQFAEIFRAMGDIGYLCDSLGELEEVVTGILKSPPYERYRRQSHAILAHRSLFSPAAIAAQLRDLLPARQ